MARYSAQDQLRLDITNGHHHLLVTAPVSLHIHLYLDFCNGSLSILKTIAIPIRKLLQSSHERPSAMSGRDRSRSRTRRRDSYDSDEGLERDMRSLHLRPSEEQLRREAGPRRRRSRRRREHTPAPHHREVHTGSRHHDSQYGISTGARRTANDHMREKEFNENFDINYRARREARRSPGGGTRAGRENDDSCNRQVRENVIARDYATTRRRDGTRQRHSPSDAEIDELLRRSPDHDRGPRGVHHRY